MKTRRSAAAATATITAPSPTAIATPSPSSSDPSLPLQVSALSSFAFSMAALITAAVARASRRWDATRAKEAAKSVFAKGDVALFASMVGLWILLYLAITADDGAEGMTGGGDETGGGMLPWLFAAPLAFLDSARHAILALPDAFTESTTSTRSTRSQSDVPDTVDVGGHQIDYDVLVDRLLDSRQFRDAVSRAAESKMVSVRDDVMRKSDRRMEEVRKELKASLVAAEGKEANRFEDELARFRADVEAKSGTLKECYDGHLSALRTQLADLEREVKIGVAAAGMPDDSSASGLGERDRKKLSVLEARVDNAEAEHKILAADVTKCCNKFDETQYRERVREAVSAFLSNVTADGDVDGNNSGELADFKHWLKDNYILQDELQSHLDRTVLPELEKKLKSDIEAIVSAQARQSAEQVVGGFSLDTEAIRDEINQIWIIN